MTFASDEFRPHCRATFRSWAMRQDVIGIRAHQPTWAVRHVFRLVVTYMPSLATPQLTHATALRIAYGHGEIGEGLRECILSQTQVPCVLSQGLTLGDGATPRRGRRRLGYDLSAKCEGTHSWPTASQWTPMTNAGQWLRPWPSAIPLHLLDFSVRPQGAWRGSTTFRSGRPVLPLNRGRARRKL